MFSTRRRTAAAGIVAAFIVAAAGWGAAEPRSKLDYPARPGFSPEQVEGLPEDRQAALAAARGFFAALKGGDTEAAVAAASAPFNHDRKKVIDDTEELREVVAGMAAKWAKREAREPAEVEAEEVHAVADQPLELMEEDKRFVEEHMRPDDCVYLMTVGGDTCVVFLRRTDTDWKVVGISG